MARLPRLLLPWGSHRGLGYKFCPWVEQWGKQLKGARCEEEGCRGWARPEPAEGWRDRGGRMWIRILL